MTVYLPRGGRSWWYDFEWRKRRYRGSTQQVRREDAALVESGIKLRLRQEAGGVAPFDRERTPLFQDWAEIYAERAAKRLKRPECVDEVLRVVLRFWGRKPAPGSKVPIDETAPYHNLRLADPIIDAAWIERFEDWMRTRTCRGGVIAASTRNHYRTALHQMFKLAMSPAWRKRTAITVNPFIGVERERGGRRTATLSVEDLRRWIAASSYHVRVALATAALAPKLRLKNVLALEWRKNIDREVRWITVHDHKTDKDGQPLVVPIVEQLRKILLDAKARGRGNDRVVTYRGRPVESIRGGLQAAAKRAGLDYGLAKGVTFHTVRHTMATMLAEAGEPEAMRKDLMGHASIQTTQIYTHIRPVAQAQPLEALSRQLPLEELVMDPRRRAGKTLIGNFGGQPARKAGA